ncbi:MAG: hypothetical protein EPN79_11735 [Burkholderiaceae bacterium]|nr:MAG: hypothetical protein EPN79_11735 [Burkholderiaceae bacterium]TBR76672.1 MAG: hypothetical protein EPN64_05330 [Burkholderiaceae bacterium]
MTPLDFPSLRASVRNVERFDLTIAAIAKGVEDGAIRNTVLIEAKFDLGRALEQAWNRLVDKTFMQPGAQHDKPTMDFYFDVSVGNLHEVHAAAKKVLATKLKVPMVEAAKALILEALPLAQAVSSLKDKVVKGRAPSPQTVPVNPNKLVMSCGCCLRPIAVLGGTPRGHMALHGYRRPGTGWQTASCPGARFMPLETSIDGQAYLLNALKAEINMTKAALNAAPDLKSLNEIVRGPLGTKSLRAITPDMPEWKSHYRRHVGKLESDLASFTREFRDCKDRITKWRPLTDAAKEVLIERHGCIPQHLLDPVTGPGIDAYTEQCPEDQERSAERSGQ